MQGKPELSRDERIKKELRKIKALYKRAPKNQQKLCEKLMENAAFMAVTLDDLQQKIKTEGAVVKATNGNGFQTTAEHPALKAYNVTVGRYAAAVDTLNKMLPEEVAEDKLGMFLNGKLD